jgi:hypothetical protein
VTTNAASSHPEDPSEHPVKRELERQDLGLDERWDHHRSKIDAVSDDQKGGDWMASDGSLSQRDTTHLASARTNRIGMEPPDQRLHATLRE